MSTTVKPRPRPRARRPPSSENTGADAPVRASLSAIEDEDDMFIRNRTRGVREWSALNKAVKKVERKTTPASDSSSSSDLDSDSGPSTKSKKHKKFAAKPKVLPEWTKNGGKAIANSDSYDSDVGSKPPLSTSPHSESVDGTPKGKRKRSISRSPSLTPPPLVSAAEQKKRRDLVAEALRTMSPPSGTMPAPIPLEEDSDEIQELDPELARIMTKARERPANHAKADSSNTASVDLRIRIIPHPEDESGRVQLFNFQMGRTDSFQDLFAEIADHLGILQGRLVVTYGGKRVFSTSSPATLSIWSAAELEACEEHIYSYIIEQKRAGSMTPFEAEDVPDTHAGSRDASAAPSESDATDRSDVFKLRLRSGDKVLTVSVRPTTKCGAIVASFVRKLGLQESAAKKARVDIDGEAMDPETEIGEADLEAGDLVDIVGL